MLNLAIRNGRKLLAAGLAVAAGFCFHTAVGQQPSASPASAPYAAPAYSGGYAPYGSYFAGWQLVPAPVTQAPLAGGDVSAAAFEATASVPGHPPGCRCPQCCPPDAAAPPPPSVEREDEAAEEFDDRAADEAFIEDALEMPEDSSLFASAVGAAEAGLGASNIVGDFFLGGGQIQFTPPPVPVEAPTPRVFSGLRSDPFPTTVDNSDRFVSPFDSGFFFNVSPPGLLSGQSTVESSWQVVGEGTPTGGQSVEGVTGTAVLDGVDQQTGQYVVTVSTDETTIIQVMQSPVLIDVPALGVDRLKITENNNPIPTDRVFFNYNLFQNAFETAGTGVRSALDLQNFTFGIENTFMCGMASVELRVPFASTLSSDQFVDGSGEVENVEFGNIGLIWKMILWQSCTSVLTGGVGFSVPSGEDVQVFESAASNDPLVTIENDAFFVTPFVATRVQPCHSRAWLQLWGQWNIPMNANDVVTNLNGQRSSGEIHDQTLMFLDAALGYDLWESQCGCGHMGLSKVSPAVEAHYTSTLEDAELFQQGSFVIGNLRGELDLVNLTFATHFHFLDRGFVTPAYVLPLNREENRIFDGEFALQAQWNY